MVHQLAVFHTILAVYKIRKIKGTSKKARKLTRYNLRGNIIVPYTHLTLLKRSFVLRGSELWNTLPMSVRNLEKDKEFKTELRKWITEQVTKIL